MLAKIDNALRVLIEKELGYTPEPEVSSMNNLRDDEFPAVWFMYREEVPVDEEDETIGFFTQDLFVDFEIAVKSDEKNYRVDSMKELSRFKKFINDFRNLVEEQHPSACVIEMRYEGMSFLGWDSPRSAGGVLVETSIRYRQCRENPENNVCEGIC